MVQCILTENSETLFCQSLTAELQHPDLDLKISCPPPPVLDSWTTVAAGSAEVLLAELLSQFVWLDRNENVFPPWIDVLLIPCLVFLRRL
jgi:hypothetical protein